MSKKKNGFPKIFIYTICHDLESLQDTMGWNIFCSRILISVIELNSRILISIPLVFSQENLVSFILVKRKIAYNF